MDYVEDQLMAGETIVHRGHVHWGIYLRPVLVSVLLLIPVNIALGLGDKGLLLLPFILMGCIFGPLGLLSAFAASMTTHYGVTTRRVLLRSGFLMRTASESALGKIESVTVDQSLLGRMFGYGGVTCTGTGGSHTGFRYFADPDGIKRAIQRQIEALAAGGR